MLDIPSHKIGPYREGLRRRDFLRVGALGTLGLTVADWFQLKALGNTTEGKAKSVIQIWANGGPTQLETFDPKPEAGEDYTGPFKTSIETNVPGTRIGHLLPLMAKQADKYSILRSFDSMSDGHETGTYIVQTGTMPRPELSYPSVGAVVALKKKESGQYQGGLPAYMSLTSSLGRFSESGFLGNEHKMFATGGDPNANDFTVRGLVPAPGMTEERLRDRRSLLETVDAFAREADANHEFGAMNTFQQKAHDLLLGDAKKAFNLSLEDVKLREKYGRNYFGQCCLLARRLVEHGVPFITINDGGWDHHTKIFEDMPRKLPVLDQGLATLLEDLHQRGLLATTIVVWYGEFGRTPRVSWEPPWFGGRHHWHSISPCVLAGGGFKGGAVVGTSDAHAEFIKDRPVYPWDLTASMYRLLGIDPTATLPHPQGCGMAHVTPVGTGDVQSGGLLTEIM